MGFGGKRIMQKRVIIVDFNHMVHTYYYSQHRLSVRVVENGNIIDKDTTIQNGTIKAVHRWSNGGVNPTAVCFDRPVPARKAFFQSAFPEMAVGTDKEYKGGREKMPDAMFEGISDVERVFRNAGISCFAEANYESDDIIFACIKRAKEKYPGMPIDVVTNDADLLPLVDDTVSVFIRSKKGTYAESKDIEKLHYIQVTPRNFQAVVEDLSAYKGFLIPYNSLLLHKLVRGDSSDNFRRKDVSRLFSPTKYNAMIERMIADDINFEDVFRYGEPQYKILYKGTNEEFNGTLQDALKSEDKSKLYQKICNSEQLDAILWCLKEYSDITDEQLESVEKVYWGMNLNQAYPNPDKRLARHPFVLNEKGRDDIHPFNEIELQKMCSPLKIDLRLY